MRKVANISWLKKFETPVQAAIARRWALPTTQRRPSFTCGHIFGCDVPASSSGSSSRWPIRSMKTAETTKLTASPTIAYGAVIAAIRPPDMLGPATWAAEAVELQLRVPVDEVLPLDERGQIRLVGDVEEDGEDADRELEHEQVPDLEDAGNPEDRDQREQAGACGVADDQDRPAAEAVDPDAGRQREEDERQEAEHAEQRERERARVQAERGEPRDRELRDLGAELADRLARPEPDEVGVRTRGRRAGGAG